MISTIQLVFIFIFPVVMTAFFTTGMIQKNDFPTNRKSGSSLCYTVHVGDVDAHFVGRQIRGR